MADSINPRCPVHGVRHKRPMCDPDEIREVILKRPYEVGDQQDTDLDADITASRAVRPEPTTETVQLTFAETETLSALLILHGMDWTDDDHESGECGPACRAEVYAAVERIKADERERVLRSLLDENEAWEWQAPVGPGNASYANGYENGRRAVGADIRALIEEANRG